MNRSMQKPKVSVIIPCYNREKHIRACIESLITQTYGINNLELIFLNDASTDRTMSIIKEYESEYPQSILLLNLSEQSGGFVGKVRNIGLSYATGEYITFVDSDDMCVKELIETLVTGIVENESCDCAGCGAVMFSSGSILRKYESFDHVFDMSVPSEKKLYLLTEGERCSVWGRIYRTDFLKEHNVTFSDVLHIAEDVKFHFLSMAYARKIATISKPLYLYRASDNSLSRTDKLSPYFTEPFWAIQTIFKEILSTSNNKCNTCEWEYLFFARGIVEVYYTLKSFGETNNKTDDLIQLISSLFETVPDILSNPYIEKATGGDDLLQILYYYKSQV